MKLDLYQFNLDFNGNYICGHKISEDANFFSIQDPVLHFSSIQEIKPVGNILCLSKNAVICYYKVAKD